MRLLLLILLASLTAPAAAVASGQERGVALVQTPTREGGTTRFPVIDAYGDRVVWSDHDAASDSWRLMEHVGGVTRPVPVPARQTPFDADLGPDGDGGVRAVYSRCERALPGDRPAPPPTAGRRYGCDLYAYSFAARRERRLGASSSGDESWPTAWRDRLAFVRSYPQRSGRRGRIPYLYWRRWDGKGGSRRLRRPERTGPYALTGLDMRSRKVAYTRAVSFDAATMTDVWLTTTTGALRRLARGATTGGGAAVNVRAVGDPALGHGALRWLFTNRDEPEFFGSVLRREVRAGRPRGATRASTARPRAVSFAYAAGTAYWIDAGPGAVGYPEAQPGGRFELQAAEDLSYGSIPANWLTIAPG